MREQAFKDAERCFKRAFREILESEEIADRDKTKEVCKVLKRHIKQHLIRVQGKLAQPRADRVARDPGLNASTSRPQTIVPRKKPAKSYTKRRCVVR